MGSCIGYPSTIHRLRWTKRIGKVVAFIRKHKMELNQLNLAGNDEDNIVPGIFTFMFQYRIYFASYSTKHFSVFGVWPLTRHSIQWAGKKKLLLKIGMVSIIRINGSAYPNSIWIHMLNSIDRVFEGKDLNFRFITAAQHANCEHKRYHFAARSVCTLHI